MGFRKTYSTGLLLGFLLWNSFGHIYGQSRDFVLAPTANIQEQFMSLISPILVGTSTTSSATVVRGPLAYFAKGSNSQTVSVSLSASDSDGILGATQVVTITARFSVAMSASPTIYISGVISNVAMTATASDSVWEYSWNVSGTTADLVTATVSGVSTANIAYTGNESLTFQLDLVAPEIILSGPTGFSYMGYHDEHYYFINSGTSYGPDTNWQNAREEAQQMGDGFTLSTMLGNTDLAVVEDLAENNFIGDYLNDNFGGFTWIGVYRENENSDWININGEVQNYFNWRSDQPSGSNQNAIAVYPDPEEPNGNFAGERNVWSDEEAQNNNAYVIEMDGFLFNAGASSARISFYAPAETISWTLTGPDASLFEVDDSDQTGGAHTIFIDFTQNLQSNTDYQNPSDANADRIFEFFLNATDVNGNTRSQKVVYEMTDTQTPTVQLSHSGNDTVVVNSEVVTITATFSEAMTATPTLSLSGIASALEMSATVSPSIWKYSWTVSTTVTSTTATVSGTDLAGNAYSGTDSLTFTISETLQTPSLTMTLTHDAPTNFLDPCEEVSFTAEFSEAISFPVDLMVDNSYGNYSYSLQLSMAPSSATASSMFSATSSSSSWEINLVPQDFSLVGSFTLTVSHAGMNILGVDQQVESLQFSVVSSTCSTGSVTVDLSNSHPDLIVSTRDTVSINALFSTAVNSPTLIYTSVVSTTYLPMVEITGTQSVQWTAGLPLSGPDGPISVTVSATGVNGEILVNAAAESITFTQDSLGPIIEYISVDGQSKTVDVLFTEDLFSDYLAQTATGTVSINDFSLTLSSTTASLTSSEPLSMTVSNTTETDGKRYSLGFDYNGVVLVGDALIVNIVSHTFDIAGNPVELQQSNNVDVYTGNEQDVTVSLSHTSSSTTLTNCDTVALQATFNRAIQGPVVLEVEDSTGALINVNLTAASAQTSATSSTLWEGSWSPNNTTPTGLVTLSIIEGGVAASSSANPTEIERLGFEVLFNNYNCNATGSITVDLSLDHPDHIVSYVDGAVDILANFSSAVDSPSLIYNDGSQEVTFPMNTVSGTTDGTQWSYPMYFSGPEGQKSFTVSASGILGDFYAGTDVLSVTFDSFGPVIEYIEVQEEDIVDIIFTEDLFSTYENSQATGAIVRSDFSLTLSSTTASLTTSVPLSMTVTNSTETDGKRYSLGFNYTGYLLQGDALMVGIVSDTYDIAGNAVDLIQSNAIEYYDQSDTLSVTVELTTTATQTTLYQTQGAEIFAAFSTDLPDAARLQIVYSDGSSSTLTMATDGILATGAPQTRKWKATWNPGRNTTPGNVEIRVIWPDYDGNRYLSTAALRFELLAADSDADGIFDADDLCLETPEEEEVDENGCALSQKDTDNDGVTDDIDICPETEEEAEVNEEGCSIDQIDTDEDGVADYLDNCVDTPNPEQFDQDGDGIGNVCDPDPSIEYIALEVSENASPTTPVVIFSAFNSNQDTITLTLSDTSGLFELLGENTIILVGELDFETNEFHIVELTATTENGGVATASITIMVSDIPNATYTGKFFVSIFDSQDESKANKVDHTRYFNPFNKGVGKWKIRKKVSGGADAALFTIRGGGSSNTDDASAKNDDESEGYLDFINPPDFENPQDHNRDNVYEVEVTYENTDDGAREVPVPVTQRNIQVPENSTRAIELQSTPTLPEDDSDSDGVPDIVDNSPLTFNPNQTDEDGDGVGDVSDDFDHDGVWNPYDNCPDTPLGEVVDENGCIIFYTVANNFSVSKTEKCAGEHQLALTIENAYLFDYQVRVTGPNTNVNTTLEGRTYRLSGLDAGAYSICVTVEGIPASEFERCFSVRLEDPEGLEILTQFNPGDEVVNFQLKGGTNFTIVHNGKTIQTSDRNYALRLAKGVNKVRITNGIECQG
ncbi:MAG: thrombospondin type 3 repeat-containing protein, partial [Flavobacteriaceae bacterium]